MRVLNDNVLILEVKGKEKTDGGIILPGQSVERPLQGTVIAVGPGEKMEDGNHYPLDVVVGDLVFYPAKTGDLVSIDGTDYRVIPEKYILGVLIEADLEEEHGCDEETCCDQTIAYCESGECPKDRKHIREGKNGQ